MGLILWLLVVTTNVVAKIKHDFASEQIVIFKQNTTGPIGNMTTSAGKPIDYNETAILGQINQILILNDNFMDQVTHMNRERIPERVVHAKAAGAFGYFEVTHDITHICKAELFSKVGKKTPIAARFSSISVERGGIDTSREPRGFAVKFCTKEGNLDMVGLNTPMFVFKDPILFPTFARSQKRNPATNLFDNNMMWDFLTLHPGTLHIFLLIFGDRGIPDGYRHMPGYGIHTFQVYNEQGESHFIRFHFEPDAGIKNLRSDAAKRIATCDPDYATRDLYNAIANGNFPKWHLKIQVLTCEDVENADFDVFDVTKIIPTDKYPLIPVGYICLDKNPINYFAEVEQLAFCPCNLVPGILGSKGKLFEARCFAYRDTQNHRLGVNFNKIAVNCPFRTTVHAYNRDGEAPVKDNERDYPNYYPNSFHGAIPYLERNKPIFTPIYNEKKGNNTAQARDLYVNGMTSEEKCRLVENLVESLAYVTKEIQQRAVKVFSAIHADLGKSLEKGLKENKIPPISHCKHRDDDISEGLCTSKCK